MTFDEQKFLNGIIRKYKPKKILEIGVAGGGTSALILNAIKDFPESKLYSIDKNTQWYKNPEKKTGMLIEEKFPGLIYKWTLYLGGIISEFIENIGDNIDLVYIDTMHLTPGEMLNWLEVLPFLKEEAIIILHDIFNKEKKRNYSNNQLLCYIRGKLILPKYGDSPLNRNIGALELFKGQNNYYEQYFLALGNQWEYMPDEKDLKLLKKFFKKYYGDKYKNIFLDAIDKNSKIFSGK